MGAAVSEATATLFADNEYQQYLLLHGLGVEMAEALAEYWHHRIREEWGFVGEDGPTMTGLFRQQYRGGRYSWGYPACPDLEDNATVARLLGADRLGIEVGEETGWQYQPEQTTSAIISTTPRPSTSSPADTGVRGTSQAFSGVTDGAESSEEHELPPPADRHRRPTGAAGS